MLSYQHKTHVTPCSGLPVQILAWGRTHGGDGTVVQWGWAIANKQKMFMIRGKNGCLVLKLFKFCYFILISVQNMCYL